MKNQAVFAITGNIGKIEIKDNVAHIDVCANYSRKVGEEWENDPHWNRVTLFGQKIATARELAVGDKINCSGRVRQTRYERDGQTVYSVDLVVSKIEPLEREPAS